MPSASGLQATLPFVEADGTGVPSLHNPATRCSHNVLLGRHGNAVRPDQRYLLTPEADGTGVPSLRIDTGMMYALPVAI